MINSDPQSDSWYYPSILYCSEDFYNANTTYFSDGKPQECARWLHTSFKGLLYPKTTNLILKLVCLIKVLKKFI